MMTFTLFYHYVGRVGTKKVFPLFVIYYLILPQPLLDLSRNTKFHTFFSVFLEEATHQSYNGDSLSQSAKCLNVNFFCKLGVI